MRISDLCEVQDVCAELDAVRGALRRLSDPRDLRADIGGLSIALNDEVRLALRLQVRARQYACEARLKGLGVEVERYH